MSFNYTHFTTYKGQKLNKDYFLDERDNLFYIEDDWLVMVPVDYDGTVALEMYYKVPKKYQNNNIYPIYERVNLFSIVKDVRSKRKR